MPRQKADVIIPDSIKPKPEDHELAVAWILAKHYICIVEFLQPVAGYKTKTPDIVMNGIMWEIKSPTGNSKKSTVEYQFKGLKQSRNLVLDGRRTKLSDTFIKAQTQQEIARHTRVGRIILIAKSGAVIELR
jgi:hypothetical protein